MSGTRRLLKVAVFHTSDFESFPRGGGISVIRDILRCSPQGEMAFTLFGITPHAHERPLIASKRVIGERTFDFIPLFYRSRESAVQRTPFVPLRVVSLLSYLRHRRRISSAGYDIFYLHAPEAWPLVRWGVPTIYHVHGPQETAAEFSRFRWVRSALFRRIYAHVIDDVITGADRVVFIDTPTYENYSHRYPNRREDFSLCRPSVDVDSFRPLDAPERDKRRRSVGFSATDKVILFAGRLSYVKGVDTLINSLPSVLDAHPEAKLVIVGDGEEGTALRALTARLKLSMTITFLGQQASDAMPDIYSVADLFVLPSRSESHGMVVLEALACGTPVVSTRVGIAAEVVIDGYNGYLVGNGDATSLAAAIAQGLHLVAKPAVSTQCRESVQNLERTGNQVIALIRSLAEETRYASDSLRQGARPARPEYR